MEKLYSILTYEAEKPSYFGTFHLFFIFLIALLTIIICKSFINTSEKQERIFAFSYFVGHFIMETYKQFVQSYTLLDGVFVFNYNYSSFPFQFCSLPLFLLPLIAFLPSGKLRESVVALTSSYLLFAGIGVIFYPGTAYTSMVSQCIQTMFWHGAQITVGLAFAIKRFSAEFPPKLTRFFLSGVPLFLISLGIALFLNEHVHEMLVANGIDATFSMFMISPYFEINFPVLPYIVENHPYPVAVFCYGAVFTALAFLTLFAVAKLSSVCKEN